MQSSQRASWQRARSSSIVCLHKAYAQQAGRPRVLKQPLTASDFTLECLTVLRKGDVHALGDLIPADQLAAEGSPVMVAGVPVVEHGPLARCSPFMDAAARRVLPGHLLRRCRVLSSLSLGSSCVQRVALTACTGEELVLTWHLQHNPWGQDISDQPADHQSQPWDAAPNTSTTSSSSSSVETAAGGSRLMQNEPNHGSDWTGSSSTSDGSCDSAGGDCITANAAVMDSSGSTTATHNSSSSSSGASGAGSLMPIGHDATAANTAAAAAAAAAAAEGGEGTHQCHPPGVAGVPDGSGDPSSVSWQPQWRVTGIRFDAADAAVGGVLPQQPHPRHSPETIVLAQLAAMRGRDLHTAAGFNILGRHHTAGWAVQLAAFRQLLERPECRLLLSHTEVRLASAACPLPRQFLVEVVLQDASGVRSSNSSRGATGSAKGSSSQRQLQGGVQGGQEGRFLWRMAMHGDGCWLVKAIEAL